MTGTERQVLRIMWQLKAADAETIAAAMGFSVSYLRDLCRSLIEKKFLSGSPAQYRLTAKGSSVAPKREQRQRVKAK
ncbi:hypothetical protein MYX84_04065 [Acidobacteria bacterium AH-259-O06]|nr:hypothetical protein [Acidobacteria bacterium AH-259-O06]